VLAALLFWPVSGLWWSWRHGRRSSERVLIEDALKHVHDCDYHGQPCTLASLSGALELGGGHAARLVARLERLHLVESRGSNYRLTPDGRREALRAIRLHRLWERYLADETGLDPSEWHAQAEIREHRMSAAEAESLASRMGDPRYDPHGDPIPTASGEIAPPRGMPLTQLAIDRPAEIVHVEDEPREIYEQLLAEGMHPGMRVRVLERDARRIRFEADAEEHVLAPVFAANLSAMELPETEEEAPGTFERLSGLDLGQRAVVVGISRVCRGQPRRRLLDLGIVPGTVVTAELRSPSGDPTAYRIRGAMIALRREQADLIHVEREPEVAA